MRSNEIFESPQTDQDAHAMAVAAYRQVVDAIGTQKSDFDVEDTSNGAGFVGYKPETVGFDQFGFPNICLLLGLRKGHGSEMGGSVSNFDGQPIDGRYDKAMVVYGLREVSDKGARDMTQTTAFRVTFLHEFVHMLDSLRSNEMIFGRGRIDAVQEPEKYFNDPAEFNAFSHEIAQPLLDMAREIKQSSDISRQDILDIYGFTGDFHTDIMELMKQSGLYKRFLTNLRPERRKALLRRLYKLHSDIMKDLPSPSK